MKTSTLKLATVVLNYNSSDDVAVLLPQLIGQRGTGHNVIIVDNASSDDDVMALKSIFTMHCPDGVVTTSEELSIAKCDQSTDYLVLNHENRGYSAGNNIGIRLAEKLGADAVLIANPDMRIDDQEYIAKLAATLFSDTHNAVASSRILGLDGKDQNPLRESTFFEEFAWPITALRRKLGIGGSYIVPINSNEPVPVQKVSGCCMMIKTSLLTKTEYLDENVFLYCEEPILSAKVKQMQQRIMFCPSVFAIHAHTISKKGNASAHMVKYLSSRKYYIYQYSSLSHLKKVLLHLSYVPLEWYHRIKTSFE